MCVTGIDPKDLSKIMQCHKKRVFFIAENYFLLTVSSLELTINSRLKYTTHIDILCKQVSNKLFLLRILPS